MRKKQLLQIAKEQQATKLSEIGVRLSQSRRQLDISLESVAERTHIQTRLLKAIEEGRLEDLPESVYVQSFIRQYANAIGLNGLHFASEFANSSDPVRDRAPWFKRFPLLSAIHLQPIHLYAGYLVLVGVSVQGVSGLVSQSNVQPELSQESLQKFKESLPVSTVPMGPNPKTVSIQPSTANPGQGVRVGVTLTDQSWVRVVADGKETFEGVLAEGTTRNWNAQKQLVVRAGNAGAIMVSFNEGKAKPLGAPGTVQEVAFPPAQLTATRLNGPTLPE
jgi:cytoskeletal protein RodZ